jgi:L-alanine-DL-glutamate epimerase-like enolase superfamily enzyme
MHPFSDAYAEYPTGQFVLVEINTDQGIVGFGEAPCTVTSVFYGETLETVTPTIRNYLGPKLVGQDPLNIRQATSIMNSVHGAAFIAKTGIDTALYDLAGKILGVPASTLLGGRQRDNIPAASEIAITKPDEMVRESRRLIELGFKVIKVKAGRNVDDEVKGIKAIRDAVGSNIELRVDPNAGWSRLATLRALRMLEREDISYIEQPIPGHDLEGLAWLRRTTGVPIMVDESVWNPHDVIRIARAEAADIINIKITKAGGLKNSLEIYTTAEAVDIPCVIGTELESCVAAAAKLQLAASLETLPFACEFTELAFQKMALIGGIKLEQGSLKVPTEPGLGMTPDRRLIDQNTISL